MKPFLARCRFLSLAVLAIAILPAFAQPQNAAVVIRPSVLRSGPSSTAKKVSSLAVGDVVEFVGTTHRSGYA